MAFEDISNVTLRVNIVGNPGQLNRTIKATENYNKSVKKTTQSQSNLIGSFTKLRVAIVSAVIAYGVVRGVIEGVVKPAAEMESALVGLAKVSENTGRSFTEMRSAVKDLQEGFGGMIDQATITNSVMKLSSTALTTQQIKEFVKVVADGSAAMGEDFNVQLGLVTRGFRQLNPNVIDNIGLNVRMDLVTTKTAKALGKTRLELTENERLMGLYNEIMEQSYVVSGAFGVQQDTLNGKFSTLKTSLKELAIAIGEAGLNKDIKKITSSFIDWVDGISNAISGVTSFKQSLINDLSPAMVDAYNRGLKLQKILSYLSGTAFIPGYAGVSAAIQPIEQTVTKPELGVSDELGQSSSEIVLSLGDAWSYYKEIMDGINAQSPTTISEFVQVKESIADLKDNIMELGGTEDQLAIFEQFYKDINKADSEAQKLADTIRQDLVNQSFELMNMALEDINLQLAENRKAIEAYEDKISVLFNRRWAGQTEAEKALFKQGLAIKQFKLDNWDVLNAVEDTTAAIKDETKAYQAWLETIDSSIESLIKQGTSKGENITLLLRQLQTARLGISNFSVTKEEKTGIGLSNEEKRLQELELAYEKDKLSYEINYDAKTESLKLWEQTNEDVAQGVNKSLNSTQNQVTYLRNTLGGFLDTEASLINQQNAITTTLAARRREWYLLKEGISPVIDLLDLATTNYNKAKSLSGGTSSRGTDRTPRRTPSGVRPTSENLEFAKQLERDKTPSEVVSELLGYTRLYQTPNYQNSIERGIGSGFGGSGGGIRRYASGGLINKPTLLVAGEAGPEMITPVHTAGGNLDQSTKTFDNRKNMTVIIEGYQKSSEELSSEIQRKFSTLG